MIYGILGSSLYTCLKKHVQNKHSRDVRLCVWKKKSKFLRLCTNPRLDPDLMLVSEQIIKLPEADPGPSRFLGHLALPCPPGCLRPCPAASSDPPQVFSAVPCARDGGGPSSGWFAERHLPSAHLSPAGSPGRPALPRWGVGGVGGAGRRWPGPGRRHPPGTRLAVPPGQASRARAGCARGQPPSCVCLPEQVLLLCYVFCLNVNV